MMLELLRDTIPQGSIWWPEWIPPYCPAKCRPGCDTLFGITIYRMYVARGRARVNPYTLRHELRDLISAHAEEYYFDKWGCRRRAPPPKSDPFVVQFSYVEWFPAGAAETQEAAWGLAKTGLTRQGAPEPGTVRLMPKWRDGMTRLALAHMEVW
jgi:hypothetical protein